MSRRLRILMVGVADSRHVEHLAIALARLGHDVHIVGELTGDRPQADLDVEGVRCTPLTIPPSSVPGRRALGRIRALRRIIAETDPDVVHAHYVWYYGFFALAAGAKPLVVSAWGSDLFRASLLPGILNRIVLHRASFVLGDSRALVARARALGAPADRSAVVNWGVDLELFSPGTADRAELDLPAGPLVLAPRELDPVYNPRVVLDAFERVADELPDAQLVFKHQGFARPDVGPIPHPERVRFVGDVPYERLPDFYRAADVCVSIPSSDSSPRSVWEAMGAGCPCVLSDLPWVHELIEPGRHALVVPIDRDAVATAILKVLTDPAAAASLRGEARELTERERDQRAEMRKLVGIYEHAIDGGRSPGETATDTLSHR